MLSIIVLLKAQHFQISYSFLDIEFDSKYASKWVECYPFKLNM